MRGKKRHHELKADMGKMERKIRDVKTTASRTRIHTSEIRSDLKQLEGRVQQLEGGGSGCCGAGSAASSIYSGDLGEAEVQEGMSTEAGGTPTESGSPPDSLQRARVELLGGADGRERIIGGFQVWSRKKAIEVWLKDEVFRSLPKDDTMSVKDSFAPGPRGPIAIVQNHEGESAFENRKRMFELAKSFNTMKPSIKADDGKSHTLWAGPSKPAHVRQQDQQLTETLSIARLLSSLTKIRLNMTTRDRDSSTDQNWSHIDRQVPAMLNFCQEALKQLIPGCQHSMLV